LRPSSAAAWFSVWRLSSRWKYFLLVTQRVCALLMIAHTSRSWC
jgi:hypothetical protein